MRIPISETEQGGWYEFGDSAIFYPIASSYYNDCMLNKYDYKVSSFAEFKQTYTIQIENGWYRKIRKDDR